MSAGLTKPGPAVVIKDHRLVTVPIDDALVGARRERWHAFPVVAIPGKKPRPQPFFRPLNDRTKNAG